jgi:outer membrane lipoprotein-sorting protein
MIKLLPAICLLLISIFQTSAWANETLKDTLDSVRKKYGGMPGITLTYEREVTTQTMSMLGDQVKGDLATGDMFFKPPYSLRLEQKTPSLETIVSDEQTLWWYAPAQKRVYKYPAKDFGKELMLLSDIFRGLINVEERFQVSLADTPDPKKAQIELKPDPPWEGIDYILVTLDETHTIHRVGIYYQLGSVTMFTLNNIKEKSNFEKDFFKFVIPEGTILLDEKSSPQ